MQQAIWIFSFALTGELGPQSFLPLAMNQIIAFLAKRACAAIMRRTYGKSRPGLCLWQ